MFKGFFLLNLLYLDLDRERKICAVHTFVGLLVIRVSVSCRQDGKQDRCLVYVFIAASLLTGCVHIWQSAF